SDFGFGSTTVHVPPGRSFYSTRLDARATLGVFVDVTAAFNSTTGVATWTFTSIDPATGDLPADPLVGFLPPDVHKPEGGAFVSYMIRPKQSAGPGTRIAAQATIVFDKNAPVLPPQIINPIDAGPPPSTVAALSATTSTSSFTVSWSGEDDAGGSGIATYDI